MVIYYNDVAAHKIFGKISFSLGNIPQKKPEAHGFGLGTIIWTIGFYLMNSISRYLGKVHKSSSTKCSSLST